MIAMPMPASPQNSSSIATGRVSPVGSFIMLRPGTPSRRGRSRRPAARSGTGTLPARPTRGRAGRMTSSAKPCTHFWSCSWSSLSSIENSAMTSKLLVGNRHVYPSVDPRSQSTSHPNPPHPPSLHVCDNESEPDPPFLAQGGSTAVLPARKYGRTDGESSGHAGTRTRSGPSAASWSWRWLRRWRSLRAAAATTTIRRPTAGRHRRQHRTGGDRARHDRTDRDRAGRDHHHRAAGHSGRRGDRRRRSRRRSAPGPRVAIRSTHGSACCRSRATRTWWRMPPLRAATG